MESEGPVSIGSKVGRMATSQRSISYKGSLRLAGHSLMSIVQIVEAILQTVPDLVYLCTVATTSPTDQPTDL